ncbi:MAG: SDR family NAD(P)-dependent oxidoreductase [bacterium]|nr:SDR family NAD(P)-dependent oxidoreductase [bacterium]
MQRSLILGGTRGLGMEIARESVKRSIQTMIVGRKIESNLLEMLAASEGAAVFTAADITKPGEMLHVFTSIPSTEFRYIFWVAGIFEQKPLGAMTFSEIDAMIGTHLVGPLKFLAQFRRLKDTSSPLANVPNGGPVHLVVIASTSSWRLRTDETVYCALKAAKAAFARNFARELGGAYPGSKVTLINPGGIKTTFFDRLELARDTSGYMEPAAVAHIVWEEVMRQSGLYEEVQVIRGEGGVPIVEYGPRLPEIPE